MGGSVCLIAALTYCAITDWSFPLLGTWNVVDSTVKEVVGRVSVTFAKRGKLKNFVRDNGTESLTAGTYQLRGGKLWLTYETGVNETFTVKSITASELILELGDESVKLTRAK